ncbi:TRAP transporter substrate-binding protein [Desmospora activa]|uniref:Tripartite ATP-independent transporter DctP family solute receptor n=1 Tax=Desmospora activa DSM 45169 TaxID=1121389 RepID=A0A2T4Z3Z8_9BACL|nr:TRAP transporter substrate-binding protein [Desmospora activa]PTM56595.1 tripartite ATP-independent transporter DctP family solute receptor [Desmospora activa DSM 45169]
MNQHRMLAITMVVALVFVLAACSNAAIKPEEDGEIKWKFAHISADNHIWHQTAIQFSKLVEEKTNGEIEISIYPSSQLGGEVDTINSIKTGAVDLTISGESMQNWAPKAALLAVPYAFRDREHMQKVIAGEIGREIEADIQKQVGLTPLFYMERSPRNLTSNQPIQTPADLKGFKMRIPNVPLFMDTWEAAGAKPVVMNFNEVFTGLQQQVIQGQENPSDLIASGGLYEVQRYVNRTEHVYSWIYVLIGNEQFASLTAEQQTAVKEAAEEAQAYGQQLFEEDRERVEAQLQEEGMILNDDVDREAFQERMIPAIKESLSDEQYQLYQRILEVK